MSDFFDTAPRLRGAGLNLALDAPRVMGVLNLTPDSFADGGSWLDPGAAVERALQMQEEGADLIDLGAESTRPGAAPVTAATELQRLVPVLERLQGQIQVPISIDTSQPEVMRVVIAAGAALINDVRALRVAGALDVVAESGVAVCLMHMQGSPADMQEAPHYAAVIDEVRAWLGERLLACRLAGIEPTRCMVDPGFGFGKTLQHNLHLLAGLGRLRDLGVPLLVGLSRKRMLGELTGRAVTDRVHASVAAALIAVEQGARIVRVHDVAATQDALRVWQAVHAASARLPASRSAARTPPPAADGWGFD